MQGQIIIPFKQFLMSKFMTEAKKMLQHPPMTLNVKYFFVVIMYSKM